MMGYIYSDPRREYDTHALPDVEVFYVRSAAHGRRHDLSPGWYWWSCFPGCLPDGEPNGPFADMDEAIRDAQSLPQDPEEDRCSVCGEANTELGTQGDGTVVCLACWDAGQIPGVEPRGWWESYPPMTDEEADALADAAERQSEERRGQLKLW